MTRRQPVFFLLDTSGSMRGEPIQAVNNGLRVMLCALRQDPYALETAYISLITFDIEAKELFPLTSLVQVEIPPITVSQAGPSFLGAALELLISRVDRDVKKNVADQKGDCRPLVCIMTDGSPSDVQAYREAIPEIKKRNFGHVVACAAGPKAKTEILKELTDTVICLDTLSASRRDIFSLLPFH